MSGALAWLWEWASSFADGDTSVWHWISRAGEDCLRGVGDGMHTLWLRLQGSVLAMAAFALAWCLAFILWKRRFFRREIHGDKQDHLFRLLYGARSEVSAKGSGKEEPTSSYPAFLRHLREHLWYPNWALASGLGVLLATGLLAGWIGALHAPGGAVSTVPNGLGKEFSASILALLTGILIFSVGLDQDDVGFIGLSRAKVVLRHSYIFPVILLGLVSFSLAFFQGKAVTLATVAVGLNALLFLATIFVLVRVCLLFSRPSCMNAAAHDLLLSYQRQSIWEEFGTVLKQEAFAQAIGELSGPDLQLDFAPFGRLYAVRKGVTVPIPAAKSGIVVGFDEEKLAAAVKALRSGLRKNASPPSEQGDGQGVGQATGPVRLVFWKQVGSSIDQGAQEEGKLWGELVFSTDLGAQQEANAGSLAGILGRKLDGGVFLVLQKKGKEESISDVELAVKRSQSLFSTACMEQNPFDADLVLNGMHLLYEDTLLLLGHAESVRDQPTSPRSVGLLDQALSEVVRRGFEAGSEKTQHTVLYLPIRYALLWFEKGSLQGFKKQLDLFEYVFVLILEKPTQDRLRIALLGDFMRQLNSLGLYYLPLPIRRRGDVELADGAFRVLLTLYNRLMKHAFDSGEEGTLAQLVQNVAEEDRLWELANREQDEGYSMRKAIALERKVVLFGFASYLHMKAADDGGNSMASRILREMYVPQLDGLSLEALSKVSMTMESDGRDALYGWHHWDMPTDGKAHVLDTSYPDRLFALMCARRIEKNPNDGSQFPVNDHLYFQFRKGGMVHSLVEGWAKQGTSFAGTSISPASAQKMLVRMKANVEEYRRLEQEKLTKADLSEERVRTFVRDFLEGDRKTDEGAVLALLRAWGCIAVSVEPPPESAREFGFNEISPRDSYVDAGGSSVDGLGAIYAGNYVRSQSERLLADFVSMAEKGQVATTIGDSLAEAVHRLIAVGSRVDDLFILACNPPWRMLNQDDRLVPRYSKGWQQRDGDERCEWQFKADKYPRVPIMVTYESRQPGFLVVDRTKIPKTTIWSLPKPAEKGAKVFAHAEGTFRFVFADLKLGGHQEEILEKPPRWLEEMPEADRVPYLSRHIWIRIHQAFSVGEKQEEFAIWLPMHSEQDEADAGGEDDDPEQDS